MPRDTDALPLVYSCSGCSSAAQLANHLALRLDRDGTAEMSCIAGVGGQVPSLVRTAQHAARTGRPIFALDGCSANSPLRVAAAVAVVVPAHDRCRLIQSKTPPEPCP
jgi:uncharacterized metal-binding protein